MNLSRLFIPLLLVLFVPWAAGASNWTRSCRTGDTITGLSPGDWACNIPTTNADDTSVIDLTACDNSDAFYWPNQDGDGNTSTTTVTLRHCGARTPATAAACWAIENTALDGDPATNTEGIYGFKAGHMYGDLSAAGTVNSTTHVVRIKVFCNGPNN